MNFFLNERNCNVREIKEKILYSKEFFYCVGLGIQKLIVFCLEIFIGKFKSVLRRLY